MNLELEALSNAIIKQKRQKRLRKQLLVMLSFIVTAITAYMLLIPALTKEKVSVVLECTAELHSHTEDCYAEDENGDLQLICGQADYLVHKHSDLCYDGDGNLVCKLPEIEEHTHSESCYTQIKTLVCGLEEDENHTHDENCYKMESILSCGKEELHTHTEECYDENGNLICGKLELKEHEHSDECFKEVQDENSIEESVKESSVVPRVKASLKAAATANSTTYTIKNGETVALNGGTILLKGTDKNGNNQLTCTVTSLVSGADYQNVINKINSGLNTNSSLDNIYVYQITKVENAKSGKPTTITVTPDNGYEFYSGNGYSTSFAYESGTTPMIALYTTKESSTQESSNSGSDNDELTAGGSDYTVTVKGNINSLKDCELVVEDISSQSTFDDTDYYSAMVSDIDSSLSKDISKKNDLFSFVGMYHIYLRKNGEEYVPDKNVNLHVTITYNSDNNPLKGINELYLGHYGKNAVNKGFSDSDGNALTGIKKVTVSGNSIEFHIKSFSVITAAALKESTNAGDSSNEWQIVTGGNLETYEYRNNVRIQKKVIPTGVENEFKIYLNVEPQIENITESKIVENTFNASGIIICQSNNTLFGTGNFNAIDNPIKEVMEGPLAGKLNNYKTSYLVAGSVDLSNGKDKYFYDFKYQASKDNKVTTIRFEKSDSTYVTFSGLNMHFQQNGSMDAVIFCLKDSNKWIKPSSSFSYSNGTVTFSNSIFDYLKEEGFLTEGGKVTTEYKTTLSTPTTVIDTMGDYIEYLGVESKSSGEVTQNGNTITWNMGTAAKTEEETANGGIYIKNAYELVYRIRLKVNEAGFVEGEHYLTNASTVLAGEGITAGTSFTSPQVKGKLPHTSVIVNMIKTADGDTNNPLANAEFTLQCTEGENVNKYYKTDGTNTSWTATSEYKIISDSNGKFSAEIPNGTYVLTETKPPDGYYTTDTWTIVIKDNKVESFTFTSPPNDGVEQEKDGYYNISNKSGKVLPNTGGTGINFCIMGGVLIIALTLLWRYIIGRKQSHSR